MSTTNTVATLTSSGALATIFDPNTQATVKVVALILAGIVTVIHTFSQHGLQAAEHQAAVEVAKIQATTPSA